MSKTNSRELFERIVSLLKETPGQSVKELATKLKTNRTFLAGYLRAMEDEGYVSSRWVGPARLYYKKGTKEDEKL